MVYYFLFVTLKTFSFFILKAFKDILQHFKSCFKFLNWWIGGFVFLMSRTGQKKHNNNNLNLKLSSVTHIIDERYQIIDLGSQFLSYMLDQTVKLGWIHCSFNLFYPHQKMFGQVVHTGENSHNQLDQRLKSLEFCLA